MLSPASRKGDGGGGGSGGGGGGGTDTATSSGSVFEDDASALDESADKGILGPADDIKILNMSEK